MTGGRRSGTRRLVDWLLQSYGAYMPKAEPGTVLVVAVAAAGAAMAVFGRTARFAHTGYSLKILWPRPSGRISAMAAIVLVPHVAQSKGHTSVLSTLQPFAPVAGAAVALIAFVGATVQYLRDRKRERELRIEEGIAESTNRLTAFPGNPDAGIGSVVAALRNLRGFVARSADPAKIETEVVEILVTVAREDLDYRDARHARFDILCLQHWKGYRSYQTKNRRENLYILDQYIGALAELEGRTGLVKSVTFGKAGMEKIPPRATNSDIALLTRLTAGYGLRLALLPPDEAQEAERRFFKITGGNKGLHERMLLAKTHEVSLHASAG
jgi:hypothetical protein